MEEGWKCCSVQDVLDAKMYHRIEPCKLIDLKSFSKTFSLENSFAVEINSSRLYSLMCHFIAKQPGVKSYVATTELKTNNEINCEGSEGKSDEEIEEVENRVKFTLGLGVHIFEYRGESILAFHQQIGPPVGLFKTVEMYPSLVLIVESNKTSPSTLKDLCEEVIREDEKAIEKTLKIFSFYCSSVYWKHTSTKKIRPLESVFLPEELKRRIIEDLADFVTRKTAIWYGRHGIPYKRCYLFFGPPGAGKSSFIKALAGHFRKNVCFLQNDNKMTDSIMKEALKTAPKNSIIVLEDVDTFFTKQREKSDLVQNLSFSGLLNALDGVDTPEGQIFILTTNHIEKLDPALIRPGRVDLRVEFTLAEAPQIREMFLSYYPGDIDCAKRFVEQVEKWRREIGIVIWGKRELGEGAKESACTQSVAALQQIFVMCKNNNAEELLSKLPALLRDPLLVTSVIETSPSSLYL